MRAFLFLFGFGLVAIYWPGLLDATTTPRWAWAAALAPAAIMLSPHESVVENSAMWGLLAAVMACVPLAWSIDPLGGQEMATHILIMFVVFWLGVSTDDLGPMWAGVACALIVPVFVIFLCQVLAGDFPGVAQAIGPAATFGNKNILAEVAALGFIICAARGKWLIPTACAIMLLTVGSLAAIGGVLAAGVLWLLNRRQYYNAATLAALLTASAFVALVHKPIRVELWLQAWSMLTPFGNGLGAYAAQFPQNEFLHHDPLQALFELGLFVVPALWLLVTAAVTALKMSRWGTIREKYNVDVDLYVLGAVVAMGFFSFPAHSPVTACCAAAAAGHILGCGDRLRRALAARTGDFTSYHERGTA